MAGRFRFLTAGESHGEALTAVIDGVPAGLALAEADINADLARRQRRVVGGNRPVRGRLEVDAVLDVELLVLHHVDHQRRERGEGQPRDLHLDQRRLLAPRRSHPHHRRHDGRDRQQAEPSPLSHVVLLVTTRPWPAVRYGA